MDMALLNASNRARTLPAATTRGWRARTSTTTTSATSRSRCPSSSPRSPPIAATTSPSRRSSGSPRRPCSRSARRSGRRSAGRRARGAPASARWCWCSCSGNLDGARELAAAGAYDWFAPARVVAGRDHGVPLVLVHPRRPARARAGAAVHAARARVRAAARAGRPAPGRRAPGRARARGACTPSTRGRIPCMAGVLALAALRARRARALRAGSRRRSPISVVAVLPFLLRSTRRPRGSGWSSDGTGLVDLALLVRLARALRRPRVRGPRVGDRGAACWRRAPWPRSGTPPRGCWPSCSPWRCMRVFVRAGAAARRLAARWPAAWRACSAPSCCTCATSSTAVRCTA